VRSTGFLDIDRTVGYNPAEGALIITLSDKMATAMKREGWDIAFNAELGHFITVKQD
jgi:hypothetical protein